MLISMNKVKEIHHFVSFSVSSFNEAKTFQRLFSLLYKSIIIEIINMQMRHYVHNGKGYRALSYTNCIAKLMLCAFQPIYKPKFEIFATYITFSQSGSQIVYIVVPPPLS